MTLALLVIPRKSATGKNVFYQSPIFCACSNFFHPNHDFVLSLVQKECHWSLCNRKIWNGNFYSRFLETQDFMFPTFIQKIATLTENRFGKKILSSNSIRRFLKISADFCQGFINFQGPRRCFFCASEKPEKPRKM